MFILGARSREHLYEVHPDLVLLAGRAITITKVDFGITEGARSIEEQQAMIDCGASSLKDPCNSRHVVSEETGYCHAIDVVAYMNGKVSWSWPLYHQIADAFKAASKELKIPVISGANWKSFPDGPHHELPRSEYP